MALRILTILFLSAALLTACGKTGKGAEHGGHGNKKEAVEIKTDWRLSNENPQPNQNTNVRIEISGPQGKPIEKFDISHEKLMHLIVVSKDLSYFDHIHPDYKGKGVFEITTPFPSGGEYKLIADFIPAGGSPLTKNHWIKVQGDSKQNPIQPDAKLIKIVEGKEITLSLDQLKAGKEVQLTFTIKDDKTKQPITNLQPYLGAVGHVVIISADTEQYIHNHPLDEHAKGPDARFAAQFPNSGTYKIWGQFQHQGKVFTVPFIIRVS